MTIKLGPILNFRGSEGGAWKVSILVATDSSSVPAISVSGNGESRSVTAHELARFKAARDDITLWRYDCNVPQEATERTVRYGLEGGEWAFAVPAKDANPRAIYASCNGFSSLKLLKGTKVPNALWKEVNRAHEKASFHLLLMGGDQVYFDSMWEELSTLGNWVALPADERIKRTPSAAMKRQITEYYRSLYLRRWSQKEVAQAFATIPTLMIWDDHDILDGWGSYPTELQECAVYKEIFPNARESFALYQQQSRPTESHPLAIAAQDCFSFGCRIGSTAILAPDMRSERTLTQVLSPKSWKAIFDWLDALPNAAMPGGVKHLFLMSSIPVVHPDFAMLENALGIFPGYQELEDDLRDHWTSVPHRQERLRLIHRLLSFATTKNCRVTLLSGDVHVGAVGTICSERDGGDASARIINQLTSSGIVHPAPPGVVLFFLEQFAGRNMNDERGIVSELIELPGTRSHFIGARNWLSLEPDPDDRYWANWHVENEKHPFTKVIHPVGFLMPRPKMPS